MNIEVRASFEKDISKVKSKDLTIKILALISLLEKVEHYNDIPNLKKIERSQ